MAKNVNPDLKKGDNITLIYMKDPYSPIPGGVKGVVTRVTNDPFDKGVEIISVNWENGRNLNLVSSEDVWIKSEDLKTDIREQDSNLDALVGLKDIFKHSDEKIFFKFLSKIRESGLVNMFDSSQFLVSGPKYLQKFIELDELRRDMEYDRDMVEELLSMAQQTKDEFIRMAFKMIEEDGNNDYSNSNINSKLRTLTSKGLRYYMMMFGQ